MNIPITMVFVAMQPWQSIIRKVRNRLQSLATVKLPQLAINRNLQLLTALPLRRKTSFAKYQAY